MMGFKNILTKILLVLVLLCSSVFAAENGKADNYLIGMTVTRAFAGNYYVRIKLRNETEQHYKLKELGNSSYAMILPQVKSLIEERDIFYENDHSDIKIVISENRDLTNRNNYYTKINFKTRNDAMIHVEAYAPKTSKTQVVINKTPEEIEQAKDYTVPNWIWYIPVGILSAICLMLMAKASSDDDDDEEEPVRKSDTTGAVKKFVREKEKIFPWQNKEYKDERSVKDCVESLYENNIEEDAETDNIVDELVKVVISQNDLVLMPGVPELPGLEKKENTKIILHNVKIDLYDAENTESTIKTPVIPEKMSLAERLRKKDLIKEADDIIFEEKEAFFENISPIKDIPETAEEVQSEISQKEEPEEVVVSEEPDEYERLLNALKKVLVVAHKIKNPDGLEPELIDTFAISENTGFSLVKFGDKVSLAGNIDQNIFIIKTFDAEEIPQDESLFMEYCTQIPAYATYSVILTNFKALVKVSPTEISIIGDYS